MPQWDEQLWHFYLGFYIGGMKAENIFCAVKRTAGMYVEPNEREWKTVPKRHLAYLFGQSLILVE